MRKNYSTYYAILNGIANTELPTESDYEIFLRLSKRQLFFVARDLIVVLDKAFATMFSGIFLHKIAVPKKICYLLVDALTFNYGDHEDFKKIITCASPLTLSFVLENRYIPLDIILSESLKEKMGSYHRFGSIESTMNTILRRRYNEIIEYARQNLVSSSIDTSVLSDEMILKISGYSLHISS